MKRKVKVSIASLLSALLALQCVPLVTKAQSGEVVTKVDAKRDRDYESVLEAKGVSVLYGDDEEVEIIVELQSAPTIETVENLDDLTSPKAARSATKIDGEQTQAKKLIEKITNGEVKFLYDYSVVLNAVSLRAPYKYLEEIQELSIVKNAYVSAKYDVVEPQMSTSNGMIHSDYAWSSIGVKGEGMRIAVLDTGLDIEHEAFQQSPTSPDKMKVEEVEEAIASGELNAAKTTAGLTSNDVYVNEKVPFAYDYSDAGHISVDPKPGEETNMNHGTHVAGTAAGYVESDGAVKFSGVAPEAQLLIMKVFPEVGSTSDAYIFAALEDSALLRADVINMSLGAAAGFSKEEDETTSKVYGRLQDKGINLMISAGNEGSSATGQADGYDLSKASNPDTAIVGSPSTYPQVTSVASVNNTMSRKPILGLGSESIFYQTTSNRLTTLGEGDYAYVSIPGVGSLDDYDGLDVNGKIALVQRGTIAFTEKINNAATKGAIGIVVYNNQAGALVNMAVDGTTIPSGFISLENGELLRDAEEKILHIYEEEQLFEVEGFSSLMSDFSSMGVTPDLKLKPEITGPGGDIYASLPIEDGNYGSMSGTSMSAPHLSGAAALIRQFVKNQDPSLTDQQLEQRVNALLMSTAVPYRDEYNILYTPRKQGAGVVDLKAATTTPVVIYGVADEDGNVRPKMNLFDDVDKTGIYTSKVVLKNTSNEAVSYDITAKGLAPELASDGRNLYVADSSVELSVGIDKTSVSVPANGEVTLPITISVDPAEVPYLNASENGTFVDGFVYFTPTSGSTVELSVPFVGFYGDWTQAPLMDEANWINELPYEYSPTTVSSILDGRYILPLGTNLLTNDEFPIVEENITISPNGDRYFQGLDYFQISLLRNAKHLNVSIVDEEGNEVASYKGANFAKTMYYSRQGAIIHSSEFDDALYEFFQGEEIDGEIKEGKYIVKIDAEMDYTKHAANNEYNTFEFPVNVDVTAPVITPNSVAFISEGESRYLSAEVSDGASLAYVDVTRDEAGQDSIMSEIITGHTTTKQIKIPVEMIQGDKVYISGIDYGLNEAVYVIDLSLLDTIELSFVEKSMNVGDVAQLEVIAPKDGETYEFVSSNPEIASVDASGNIVAVSPGQTAIKVSDSAGNVAIANIYVDAVTDFTFELQQDYFTNIQLDTYVQLEPIGFQPEVLEDEIVSYTVQSASSAILQVDANGLVKAIGLGTGIVDVTIKGITKQATIEVVDTSVLRIVASDGNEDSPLGAISMNHRDSISIYGFVSNETGDARYPSFTYESADPSVLEVSSTRNVGAPQQLKGVGVGETTLTISDGVSTSVIPVTVNKVIPTMITLDTTSVLMSSRDTKTLIATFDVEPSLAEDGVITWSSYDPSVVSVDASGNLTPIAQGTTRVKAVLNSGVQAIATVTIQDVAVETIAVNKTAVTLQVGESHTITSLVSPSNATYPELAYASSTPSVATVAVDGIVQGVAPGVSTIKVSSSNGVYAEVVVTVVPATTTPETGGEGGSVITPDPVDPGATKATDQTNTGVLPQNSNTTTYIVLATISIVGIGVLFVVKRKKETE